MILGLLQARVSSRRLPGKVLKPILGVPMLLRQIERLARCRRIDRLVVATSTDPSDDPLVVECQRHGIGVYKGSLSDVLGRFADASRIFRPNAIVRLTGVCPLADWELIDQAIELFETGGYDYITNFEPPTYPDGLDVEVVSTEALLEVAVVAQLPSEREHVTLFIRNHPERYKIGRLTQSIDLSSHRWTVDDPEDLDFVQQIYQALYPTDAAFTTDDILSFVRNNPELLTINAHIGRNEGLKKSLILDEIWLSKGTGRDER
jgi:spore coat polysaccharide biosynthesis protein SpsF